MKQCPNCKTECVDQAIQCPKCKTNINDIVIQEPTCTQQQPYVGGFSQCDSQNAQTVSNVKGKTNTALLILTFINLFIVISLVIVGLLGFKAMSSKNRALDSYNRNLLSDYAKLDEKNNELTNKFNDLESSITAIANKAYFLDKSIALVADDKTRVYHTLDCELFQNCESYWSYNTDEAVSEGYTPCPICHKK